MAKIYQYDMKVPFDMSDVNGFIKMPQLILLSLQVSGMQSMEIGISDRDLLEQYNLVWIITDYDITVHRLPVFHDRDQGPGPQSSLLLPFLCGQRSEWGSHRRDGGNLCLDGSG